ncbi:hypothetical protein T08_12714 [Trichinella sp. T8]|nr:hypothetical protein T08_12714 [Trichinella sp. T8]
MTACIQRREIRKTRRIVHGPLSPWRGHGSSITVCVHSVTQTAPMQAGYFQLSIQLE